MKLRLLLAFCLGIFLLAACSTGAATQTSSASSPVAIPTEASQDPAPTMETKMEIKPTETPSESTSPGQPLELTSPVFAQGEPIPAKYSCDGEDVSPPLTWNEPPIGTQSLALIMDDPDAPVGTWDHWVAFNFSPELRELPEGMKAGDVPGIFGKNSWGRNDYGGPCPPSGTHRYFFKLYALDTTLSLDKSADKKQVLAAMEGHVLAEAELMGTFNH